MIKFGTTWWKAVLDEMCNKIRRRARNKHKNADNKKFKSYADSYEKIKSEGKAVSSGSGRRKGESQKSYSTTPDMTLTGRTLDELQPTNIKENGGELTFLTQGGIVRKLAKHKNYKIVNVGKSNPLGKDETDFFVKEFDRKMKKGLKKMGKKYSKTIRVKL